MSAQLHEYNWPYPLQAVYIRKTLAGYAPSWYPVSIRDQAFICSRAYMTGVYLKETFNRGCMVDNYFTNWLSAHLHLLKFSPSLTLRAFAVYFIIIIISVWIHHNCFSVSVCSDVNLCLGLATLYHCVLQPW